MLSGCHVFYWLCWSPTAQSRDKSNLFSWNPCECPLYLRFLKKALKLQWKRRETSQMFYHENKHLNMDSGLKKKRHQKTLSLVSMPNTVMAGRSKTSRARLFEGLDFFDVVHLKAMELSSQGPKHLRVHAQMLRWVSFYCDWFRCRGFPIIKGQGQCNRIIIPTFDERTPAITTWGW